MYKEPFYVSYLYFYSNFEASANFDRFFCPLDHCAVAQFEREEAERRTAEREERKSLEKELVERIGGRMEPIVELPEATCCVASVASSSFVADEMEREREALRRTGAIPKRLASRGREERNPRQSPVDSPASPDGNRGGEGGARSEEDG